ncbi:MAG: ribose-5-phosphate isomerase RpiA [Myxococcales bacterium]|nr:ribose-5-phosphate isomerase RpiA [Myxococcales bacterium]
MSQATRDPAREKARAAHAAAERVEPGMIVGLGSGSTALLLVDALGDRCARGLDVVGVPTSEETAARARRRGIPLIEGLVPPRVDLVLDGTDEFDDRLRLIKGGGGMLLREKIVASAAARMLVMCDHSKRVDVLGAFPLPVEVVPMARARVARSLTALGVEPTLRIRGGEPFVTDEGNVILDCPFGRIDDPDALAAAIIALPGVVEHGLFIGLAHEVLMAEGDAIRVFRADEAGA